MNLYNEKKIKIIYGYHACFSALNNNNRKYFEINILEKNKTKYKDIIAISKKRDIKIIFKKNFNNIYSSDNKFVHQGVILKTSNLVNKPNIFDINIQKKYSLIIILDNITDPRNIGSLLRTAAAFDIEAIIIQNNISYDTSTIAKIASGALDMIPIIETVNIKHSINYLKKNGYFCYAIEENGNSFCNKFDFNDKSIFIMGSEGKGIKKSVEKYCDDYIKIPTSENMRSLNVSNAATILIYEYNRQKNKI